ncbi:MAG: hypothetical protein ACI807_003871 [Paracoccaceae bacterium]|jgi:hypothetical protein
MRSGLAEIAALKKVVQFRVDHNIRKKKAALFQGGA